MSQQALIRFGKLALDVALFGLVLCVVAQNRFLASKLKGQQEILDAKQGRGISVGGRLRNLAAVNLEGVITPIAIPEAGQKLLIIGTSAHCPYCKANQTGWSALASPLGQREDWRVLWISRDPLEESRKYFGPLGTPLSSTLADPPNRTYEQLGLRIVPRTIVVLPGGTVDKVWTGQLTTAAWKEVFSYFGLDAPKSLL